VVFPQPRAAHDGHHFSARDLQRDALEDRAILVGKIKIPDLDQIFGRHSSIPGQENERELYLSTLGVGCELLDVNTIVE
jgi:hypothetical protein